MDFPHVVCLPRAVFCWLRGGQWQCQLFIAWMPLPPAGRKGNSMNVELMSNQQKGTWKRDMNYVDHERFDCSRVKVFSPMMIWDGRDE